MNNTNSPLISVIIAVYNPGKYLRSCLDSIVNQTYKNLEIILVDDGSTDESLAVCKEYAEKDNRVIVYHKENSGVSATRNKGIELSHGDYYSFIDSDDWLESDTYEYLINIINEHRVDAVIFEHFITYHDRENVHKASDDQYGLYNKVDSMERLVKSFPFAWNKLFSKRIIDGIRFNELIARGEDGLFARQAFDKAESAYFVSKPLYHYVQSEESAVRGKFRKSQLTALKLIDIYDSFFVNKYPNLHGTVMCQLLNLLTMLYVDMRSDESDYKSEQKTVVKEFRKIYSKTKLTNLETKQKLLLKLFRVSPTAFYLIKKLR